MSILHVSLSADDPERIARFLAGIMGGYALEFPPFPGAWIAFARADDGTAIEVYPTTHVLTIGHESVACEVVEPHRRPTFAHAAISSTLEREEIFSLGAQEGWVTRVCNRGPFACIEIWLEDRLLVEVLDPDMQADYASGMTVRNWRAMFGMD